MNLSDRFVVVYSARSMLVLTEEMADCFVTMLKAKADRPFALLTPTKHDRLRD